MLCLRFETTNSPLLSTVSSICINFLSARTCYDSHFTAYSLRYVSFGHWKNYDDGKEREGRLSRWSERKELACVRDETGERKRENRRERGRETEREREKAAVASSHPHGRRASLLLNSLYWLSASRTGTSARRWLVSPRGIGALAAKSFATSLARLISQFHLSTTKVQTPRNICIERYNNKKPVSYGR